MASRTLNPSLSRRFKSLRYGYLPFYRRSGVYAAGHAVRRSANLPAVDSRTVISLDRRYLFVRIPKCANTTILTALWLCETGYRPEDVEQLSDRERKTLLRKQTMKTVFASPSQLDRRQVDTVFAEFRKCIFVRNPYSRLASAYLDKFVRGTAGEDLGLGRTVSFADFCEFLVDGGLHSDVHWMPQAHLCPVPVESLDLVGHMETFREDMDRMFRLLYGVSAPLLDRQHHATGADARLKELYGEREMRLVRELYAEDFHVFGYGDAPF